MKTSDDRRKFPRLRRRLKAQLDEASPGILNHVEDISVSGVLCHTVRPVPLMTRIGIGIDLPFQQDPHRIDAEGVVVRCEPETHGEDRFQVAILFTRINDDDARAIETFVDQDLRHTNAG